MRVADFCRENMLDYYEMVEALKQEKLETESYEEQVQCGDLVMQTEAQDTKIQERDDRILGLLDQIANNMVRKEDVDRIVKDAVDDVNAKWQKRFDDYQEETEAKYKKQMEAMAAEYEAKIAEIRNRKDGKGDDKDQTPGKSTKNSRKKGGTVQQLHKGR